MGEAAGTTAAAGIHVPSLWGGMQAAAGNVSTVTRESPACQGKAEPPLLMLMEHCKAQGQRPNHKPSSEKRCLTSKLRRDEVVTTFAGEGWDSTRASNARL